MVVTTGPGQAQFLDECLASVRSQGYRAIEILETSWGPDGDVPSLAEARSLGMNRAAGEMVRVLEASDRLPPGSTTELVQALRSGAAGMAAGRARTPGEGWRRTALRPAPEFDLGVGHRLIDLVAWRAAGLGFDPIHGRFSEPDVARAHAALGTTTVAGVVLDDMDRPLGLPFAHPRPWAREVVQWAAATTSAMQVWGDGPGGPEWAGGVISGTLRAALEDVANYDETAWVAVREVGTRLLDASQKSPEDCGAEAGCWAWLAAQDRRTELEQLVEDRWRDGDDIPTTVEGGEVFADLSRWGIDVPAGVRRLGVRETPLFASVRRAAPTSTGTRLEVATFIRGVDSRPDDEVAAWSVSGDARTPVAVTRTTNPEATRIAEESYHRHDDGWLVLEAPTGADVRLAITASGVRREGSIAHHDHRAGPGHLNVRPLPIALASATLVDGDAVLELRGVGASSGQLSLRSASVRLQADATPDGAGFLARVPMIVDPWSLGSRPAPLADYWVELAGSRVGLVPELIGLTPTDEIGPIYRLRVRADNGAALLELSPPRGEDQIGVSAQRRLQEQSPRAAVDPGLVYFQSYAGGDPTDNPLAIHVALRRRHPDLRVRWGVTDPTVPVPEGAERVLLRSPEWYDTLASAGYLVSNIEMDDWWVRRPEQRFLMTWHGNPSKAMGIEQWRQQGFSERRISDFLHRRAHNWSALVSPTPEMSEHYRTQFAYDGPILDHGHPRNDVLLGPDADALRAQARQRLGLRDGVTAILYGPTWRPGLATNHRRAGMDDSLDLAVAARELGKDCALLVRGHRFHRDVPLGGAEVLDVTGYPEINDLILAADVGLFDYSSLRFDFGATRRPQLFLVPDLEEFTGGRGFLYPFLETAPGPLLTDTAGVIEAIRDLPRITQQYAESRAAFAERFHPYPDGLSADRVVESFFG